MGFEKLEPITEKNELPLRITKSEPLGHQGQESALTKAAVLDKNNETKLIALKKIKKEEFSDIEEMKKSRPFLFRVEGLVLRGDKLGQTLGFPTANLVCDDSVPSGIYAGEVIWKGTNYLAALYKEDRKNALEAHLLDFSGNLYGEKLTVLAYQKIREAKIFPKREELIAAILQDIAAIKKLY